MQSILLTVLYCASLTWLRVAVHLSDQARTTVQTIIGRLNTLKRKLHAVDADETRLIECCATRIDHLIFFEQSSSPVQLRQLKRQRVHRLIVDYMLRTGLHK